MQVAILAQYILTYVMNVFLYRLLAVGINELLVAACVGDSDIIRSLVIEKEFSPSHQFQQGVTALHEACEGGHEHCVAVLIELGAEVNKQVSSLIHRNVYMCTALSCIDPADQIIVSLSVCRRGY